MSAAEERPKAPPLEHRSPLCSVCEREVWLDGGDQWLCDDCGLSWSYDEYEPEGEWHDPEAPQCSSATTNPWTGRRFRCYLSAGHEGHHVNPEQASWGDPR